MPPAPTAQPAPFIIGFDAEWVIEPTEPEEEGEDAEELLPTNRVLSYQYAVRHAGTEWSGIMYVRDGQRVRFAELLSEAIQAGLRQGHIRKWPKEVIATAHWSRADLSAMSDFAIIKGQFDGVQKTYVTLHKPYLAKVTVGKRARSFSVTLLDTQLLVPGATKALAALGQLYNFPKIDIGRAPDGTKYIEQMDRLMADNPELYKEYAIRDAEISALHVERLTEFCREELGLERMPVTLGGVSADVLVNFWDERGISPARINGYENVKVTYFNRDYTTEKSRRYLTKPGRKYLPAFILHRELAAQCFHGGRNECYAHGPTSTMDGFYEGTPEDGVRRWREFDLKGAYATSLSALRVPDYAAARVEMDPTAYTTEQMGFALVRFRFPKDCRFPCLPVEADCGRGLVFPRCGESYATSPEIALARHLGAELEILHGVIVPWTTEEVFPFREVIRDLKRRRSEHEKGTLSNELFKQLGNGIYGKLAQGIKGTKAFNTRSDSHEEIGESKITNPYLAAHVTGLIRALLGELISAAGERWTVINATTDSIVTNCGFSEISMFGPIANYMIGVAEALEGQSGLGRDAILEQKFEATRLLPWRTRGIATLACEGRPKLAKAGMRSPDRIEPNAWFITTMADRSRETKYISSEPMSFTLAHRRSADHVFTSLEKTCNFEYDFKRHPVTPVPKFVKLPVDDPEAADTRIVQMLSFNTVPWESIEDFNTARGLFETFRTKHEGTLKTLKDWKRWEEFKAGTQASKAGMRRSTGGPKEQALRIFIRAYVQGSWGLAGSDYKRAAEALSAAGFPTREQAFKDAKRRRQELPEHAIPAEAAGIPELISALLSIWPEFEAWRMLDGTCGKSENPAPSAPSALLISQ